MRRIVVRRSPIHGRGVFALTNIPSGEFLVEYKGEVTSWRVASQRYQRNRAEDGHTFFFGLDGAYVIDGARGGNSARWLNHCCEPNCEAEQEGSRVFIRALADIIAGEELFIDYLLDVKGRRTAAVKKLHACRCGARHCRGTMLAPR
jgi:SET domain-containing protein